MSTKTTTPVQPEQATELPEPTPPQIVNAGILRVIEATGVSLQKSRYKAQRAIAWQAFMESIEAGDFEALVNRAIAKVGSLPSGWEIEPGKATPSAPVKKATR